MEAVSSKVFRGASAIVVMAALWAGQAFAHGVGSERSVGSERDGVVTESVRFFYSGGDPMARAAIRVFSPADGESEYQTGFADAEGRFAFVPNAAGDWRVEATDGMGHRAEAAVAISSGAMSVSDHRHVEDYHHEVPTVWKAALGLSLILNLALLAQLAARLLRKNAEAARAHQ